MMEERRMEAADGSILAWVGANPQLSTRATSLVRHAGWELGLRDIPALVTWVSLARGGEVLNGGPRTIEELRAAFGLPASAMTREAYNAETEAALRAGLVELEEGTEKPLEESLDALEKASWVQYGTGFAARWARAVPVRRLTFAEGDQATQFDLQVFEAEMPQRSVHHCVGQVTLRAAARPRPDHPVRGNVLWGTGEAGMKEWVAYHPELSRRAKGLILDAHRSLKVASMFEFACWVSLQRGTTHKNVGEATLVELRLAFGLPRKAPTHHALREEFTEALRAAVRPWVIGEEKPFDDALKALGKAPWTLQGAGVAARWARAVPVKDLSEAEERRADDLGVHVFDLPGVEEDSPPRPCIGEVTQRGSSEPGAEVGPVEG